MKVILYMATTANGMIAKPDDSAPWTDIIFKSYYSFVKKAGNIVVGHKTYKIMAEFDEFKKLNNPVTVVLSSYPKPEEVKNKNHFFVDTPQKALEILKKKGFKTAIVGGGGKLNSAFMTEELVDEVIIQIEPFLFGKGIKLFKDADFEASLELLDVKKLSKNKIQLHYKVKEIVDVVKEII